MIVFTIIAGNTAFDDSLRGGSDEAEEEIYFMMLIIRGQNLLEKNLNMFPDVNGCTFEIFVKIMIFFVFDVIFDAAAFLFFFAPSIKSARLLSFNEKNEIVSILAMSDCSVMTFMAVRISVSLRSRREFDEPLKNILIGNEGSITSKLKSFFSAD